MFDVNCELPPTSSIFSMAVNRRLRVCRARPRSATASAATDYANGKVLSRAALTKVTRSSMPETSVPHRGNIDRDYLSLLTDLNRLPMLQAFSDGGSSRSLEPTDYSVRQIHK
jgi:hypothetical protein